MNTVSKDKIKIPYFSDEVYITYSGIIYSGNDEISFDDFKNVYDVDIESLDVLRLIAVTDFNWPPAYWKHLCALGCEYEYADIENMVLGIRKPVESMEYPGFYMIPYYTNYVISKSGKLIKKSNGQEIIASLAATGYYTFRVTGDDKRTGNRLRHRLLAMAFIPYDYDFATKDINHKNGIPGSDEISNLEWCTRLENIEHAYDNGLRFDNTEVEVFDMVTERVYRFRSYSQAGTFFNCSGDTIKARAKTNGYKCFKGYQYRKLNNSVPFPRIEMSQGDYEVTLPDNRVIQCPRSVAARYCDVTESSLSRLIREGRNQGNNKNVFVRKLSPDVE